MRKLRKIFLFFLLGILGVLLLVVVILNMPFSQRFATRQVNQILESVSVPIHLEAIRKIMPGSVSIQGIVISDLHGDSIIYAGELQADIRLVSLLRSKVVLQDLDLDAAFVEITRNSKEQKLNIAAAFQSEKKKDAVPKDKAPTKWEISIKKGRLTNIDFLMKDSISGLHISQIAADIELGNFRISLAEREIFCRTLYLGDANGMVSLTPRLKPPKEKKGASWNMGFSSLALDDVDFTYSNLADSLKLESTIGKGSIRANEIDFLSRTIDIKDISFDESIIALQTRTATKKQKKQKDAKEDSFPWRIRSEDIDIRNSIARLGSLPVQNLKEIDIRVVDLRLDKDQAAMKVRKIAFETDNGFSLKKMSGLLDSDRDQTQFQLEIKSANSRLGLEGSAETGYHDILSAPGGISKGIVEIEKSHISLHDLSYFMEVPDSLAFYSALAASPLAISARLNIEGPVFSLSECSLSQEKNFNLVLDGDFNNPFQYSKTTGDLDLEISGFTQAWMESLAEGFGISQAIPELSDLTIHGNISDSLMSPDIQLELVSQAGNVDMAASFDFLKDIYMLAYSIERLALGELLSMPDLGYFTGAGEIKGRGFSGEDLEAGFYLQIDTLGFKSYEYGHTQMTGTIESGLSEIQLISNDPWLKADLTVTLNHADSAFTIRTSGLLHAQLNELHLVQDTLAVETTLEARLTNSGKALESELMLSGLTLATPWESAVVQEITADFKSDSLRFLFQADADFFQVDIDLMRPFNELDSLGKGYQNYFESFREASHITADNRVSVLPEVNVTAHISHHEILDILVEDSGFYFSNLDASISKQAEQNSLHAFIRGEEVSYKFVDTGKLSTSVSDSAGIINVELIAENASLFSGPENRWMVSGSFHDRTLLTSFSINDYLDQNIYRIDVSGRADSMQIVLGIPSEKLTLNGKHWQLEKPHILSVDLASNRFIPSLQMKRDSSYLHLLSRSLDSFITYQLDLNQVELGSLIRTDIFPGSPEGTFTGSLELRTDMKNEREIATGLQLSDIRFFEQDLMDIKLDAALSSEPSGAYVIDLDARSDSLTIQLKGEGSESGERRLDGSLSYFPLSVLEPFIQEHITELGGSISGKLNMSSSGENDQLDGELMFHDARIKVNILNNIFRIPTQQIKIADEKMMFDNFTVLDTLDKPLALNGFVDLGGPGGVSSDLNITSSKLQVMSRDIRSTNPLSGDVFVDSEVSIKGPLAGPDVKGKILLSEGTEIFYQYKEDLRMTETQKVVNFVDHTSADEELEASRINRPTTLLSSTIETNIEMDPNTRINFTLAKRMYNIDMDVKGGGNILYNVENEQFTLSGTYEIGEGSALLKLVGWPDKIFSLAEGGFIRWEGLAENPQLNLEAENKVSTSYVNPVDGKNRPVDFFVILKLSGYLSEMDVLFTINTPDQYVMSIINTMSPEEQMRQAMSVLLFEIIDLPGISSSTDYMTQQVNAILSSQLNQFTKSTIKGVDISFGLDTYDQSTTGGVDETSTSLSYEVRKSLMNNRAQIEVSGRVNDGTQTTGSSDNSLSNVSFEYQLDSAASKYLKVYNEHNYDDVFDGEVIQTGIGFSYRKRYKTFKDIWRRKE